MLSLIETARPDPCPAPFNLAAYVLRQAEVMPDKIALQILRTSGAERWSYARLKASVLGVSGGLAALGLPAGARVLLRLGNGVEFPLAFLGAIAAGLIPVAMPAGLTVPEVTALALAVEPALCIAADGISFPEQNVAMLSSGELRQMADGAPGVFAMGDPERAAYMVYTSGTSGTPRAVVHAHRAVWARRMMWQGWYGLRESDRVLHAGAMNWTFTLGTGLLDPWAIGATSLVPAAGTEIEQLPLLLKRFDATLFAAAPGIYRRMLKSGAPMVLPKLRHALSAGEALPEDIRGRWIEATCKPLYEAYGMSECSTFVSASPSRPAPDGATGYAQPGRHIAVLGEDGAPVAREESGTLAVHRDDQGLFLEYHGAADDRRSRFCGDWFLTGDRVSMAQDGAIRYLGRDDDMMNAGGFRVSPLEVEACLSLSPLAGSVAVVELQPDATRSYIAAFYTGDASAEDLARHAEANLAPYKRPRAYHSVAALPMTANGKLNRRALRQEWRAII
jgi:acyl-coenzyme A synthetase/AMP-(fatty) acid ligase